jgi:hypothetical protein
MKRIVILFLLWTCTVYSQSYFMNVWVNGQVTSIPVQEIKKISFSGLSTSVVENEKIKTVIKNFALFQNYPNPFNPSTTIYYQIPKQGDVEIRIFNITGELVKTFINSSQPAGKYSVVWDGKNNEGQQVASGVYLYRVIYGSSVLAKKMILVK